MAQCLGHTLTELWEDEFSMTEHAVIQSSHSRLPFARQNTLFDAGSRCSSKRAIADCWTAPFTVRQYEKPVHMDGDLI
jgi:hypothetical protein